MKKFLACCVLLSVLMLTACGQLANVGTGSVDLDSVYDSASSLASEFVYTVGTSFDQRMYMGTTPLKTNPGQEGAQKVWYGGRCWTVVGYEGNGPLSTGGALTLLHQSANDTTYFRSSTEGDNANVYAGSDLERTINGWVSGFSSQEQKPLISVTVPGGGSNFNSDGYDTGKVKGDSVNAVICPLTLSQAEALPNRLRSASQAWWVGNPGDDNSRAQVVSADGSMMPDGLPVDERAGVRPAFHLNTGAILFTSSAYSDRASDEWVLTLKDDGSVSGLGGHSGFSVSSISSCDGKNSYIQYTGAATGSNEYLSILITNSLGEVKSFDRLEKAGESSGVIVVNVDGLLNNGETMYLLNEQHNGDKRTGYASSLQKITVPSDVGHRWTDATCTDPKTCTRCGATEGEALGHDWKEATCTEPKTCQRCQATEGQALGHHWEIRSCTEPRVCTTCGAKEEQPVGHEWKEATCTDPKTCTRCGATEGEALGHDWKEATCTDSKTCKRCGATEGSALGHKWKDSTCTEPKTCEVCGAIEGDPAGHQWVTTSCTEPRKCSVCGESEKEAPGHQWKEATCTDPKTCTVCGATEGNALGHDWKDATCTDPKTCTRCGATEGKALGHKAGAVVKENEKLPTCENKGSYDNVVYCTVCKAEMSRETKTVAALGHKWNNGQVTTKATCEKAGVMTYTCLNDESHTRTEEIKATGHNWDEGKITKQPTCEGEGEKTFTCKNDSSHTRVEKIKPIGHSWDEGKITKEPTCEAEGEKTFTCKNDKSHTKVEKVKAKGHSWDEGKITKEPTCEAAGEKTFTCKNDKTHTKVEKVEALGHNWGEWETTKAPTVTSEGEARRVCKRCNVTETKRLDPVSGHVLTFDSMGGPSIAPQDVAQGKTPTMPQSPSREGYTFTGWYKDRSCQTPFDFTQLLTEDTTVYAGWKEIEVEPEPEPEPTPEPENEDTPTPDNSDKKASPLIWLIAAPVALAAVAGGYFFTKKRIRK